MTKYEKVKKMFTEFAVNRNDARVSVTVKEDCNIYNQISIKVECNFDKYFSNVSYEILFTASKMYPSKGLLNAMTGIDYTIKALYVDSFSVTALENLINSILNAAVWEIETKLKLEKRVLENKN